MLLQFFFVHIVTYRVHPGLDPRNPAASCAEILSNRLNARSGYYWLWSANGSAVRVFCDMTLTCKGVGGGWMQVAKLNMTNSSHQCPPGTRLRTDLLASRLCGIKFDGPGCSSTTFDTHSIRYTQVCGKINAYQDASPDAFGAYNITTRSNNIDSNYVDGISLTHGRNPQKHLWTFVCALDEVGISDNPLWKSYCPCINAQHPTSSSQPPSFVGNDYFCDTGNANQRAPLDDNPLWDGAGCGVNNTCCMFNNPPWFLKQLPSTSTDDIEMRMCRDQHRFDEDTPIEVLELYIR